MAGITQTIPQYALGMSEQPDSLKFPGQVKEVTNAIPDVTKGLFKRPGLKRVDTSAISDGSRTVSTDEGKLITLKNNRIKELLNFLDETDGKVIIWANYRHDIKTITKELENKYGTQTACSFYGDTAVDDRDQIVSRFQDQEDDLKYLVANPKTGGYGLTLTASHTVVYYSNSYDLEIRLQSEDRTHRIGQNNKVTYVDFIAEKTVDENIVKCLRSKIDIATEVLGEDLKSWLV